MLSTFHSTGLLAAVAATLLVAPAAAQTTHAVQLFASTFSPANLTIDAGDTVLWDWVVGTHNVESGTLLGGHDGNFLSGSVTADPATTYSVTFDAAFLQANPMPGNVYPYFCVIHAGIGMTGTVTVNVPASVRALGCGVNPAASLQVLAGAPQPGTTMTLGLDNPLGTQGVGSIPFVAVSRTTYANDPCGVQVPGFGMSGIGELLVGIGGTDLYPPLLTGSAWLGVGSPAAVGLTIPNDGSLVGLEVYVQGVLVDPTGSPKFGLTDGFGLLIGN